MKQTKTLQFFLTHQRDGAGRPVTTHRHGLCTATER